MLVEGACEVTQRCEGEEDVRRERVREKERAVLLLSWCVKYSRGRRLP